MLTFIPTPIGNLEDISYRAVRVLSDSILVLCEDTRVSKRLFSLLSKKLNIDFDIKNKKFISLHSHNEQQFIENLTDDFFVQTNAVYLTDAGMPTVSDPGAKLVHYCQKQNIEFEILPGATACTLAYAYSGFLTKEFLFFGFLDIKQQNRITQLKKIVNDGFATVIYESPKRVMKLLDELISINYQKDIFVAKELTKIYDSRYYGSVDEIYQKLKDETIKGEWVVVLDAKPPTKTTPISVEDIAKLDIPPKTKAKLLSKLTGKNTKEIYKEHI